MILDTFGRKRSRQARDGGSFGIVLVDLDHFKYVNDSCGHLAGDAVSRETTQRMMPSVRPYDTVGRYGGQKFLIVAPSSDGPGCSRIVRANSSGHRRASHCPGFCCHRDHGELWRRSQLRGTPARSARNAEARRRRAQKFCIGRTLDALQVVGSLCPAYGGAERVCVLIANRSFRRASFSLAR